MLTEIERKNVKEVYEEIASHFDNTRKYSWDWINNFINNIPKNSLIADIGCGNGRNMNFSNYNFIGVDNCENFIKICSINKQNVILGNMINLPLQSKKFDAVICIAAFHHLYNKENRILCLLELKRIIKENGEILLSVWSINQPIKTRRSFKKFGDNFINWNKFGKIYERYYYIFQIPEIYNLFKEVGLKIKEHKYDCGNEIFRLVIS